MSKVKIGDRITSRIGDVCERGTVCDVDIETFFWVLDRLGTQTHVDRHDTEGFEWVRTWDTVAVDVLRVTVALAGER